MNIAEITIKYFKLNQQHTMKSDQSGSSENPATQRKRLPKRPPPGNHSISYLFQKAAKRPKVIYITYMSVLKQSIFSKNVKNIEKAKI